MIRLFLKFSIATILLGIFSRWLFFTYLESNVYTDRERVISGLTEVQLDGLRLLASELTSGDEPTRQRRWELVQKEFQSPIEIRELAELTNSQRDRLKKPNGFIYFYRNEIIDYLGVALDSERYLRLGPIAHRIGEAVASEVADWLKILALRIESVSDVEDTLARISADARVKVELVSSDSVPHEALNHLKKGAEPAFYGLGKNYYVVMPIKDRQELLRLGPLLRVRSIANESLNVSMGVWLAAVLTSTGWLVYKLAKKFKRIERAAIRISEGQFDTRVDEHGAGESTVLATAFNLMASKTEASIRAKSELLQMVSHELRTPLSRLRFAAELLYLSQDDHLKQSRMTIIRKSIDNLDAMVDEVLEYVRNEDTDPAKSREKIEIRPSLEPMLETFSVEYPNIQIDWDIPQSASNLEVYADRIALHRAIGNLLSNAFRYARSKVRIHLHASVKTVCIDVEDDGPGIPETKRTEILAPFVRLTKTSINETNGNEINYKGLGLGLAIVDRILKQHRGSIKIEQGELGGCLVQTVWPNAN
jgi:signal transduction histidine kinase